MSTQNINCNYFTYLLIIFNRAKSLALLSAFMSIENIENKVLSQYASHNDKREEFSKTNETTVSIEISLLKHLRRVFREKIIENLKSFKILNPLQVN